MKINKIIFNKTEILLSTIIFLLSVFGRNLTGLYFFKLRLGEYIIAFLFFGFHVMVLKEKNEFTRNIYIFFLVLFYLKFFSINFSLDNFLAFRFSSSIWVIAAYFIGQNLKLNEHLFVFTNYLSLATLYILNYVYYPEFLARYFVQNSDKFDFTKPSDLFLIFAITIFLTYKLYKIKYFILSFVLLSLLYLPIFYYQSRGSFLGYLLITFLFVIDIINNQFEIDLYKVFAFLCILILFTMLYFISNLEMVDDYTNQLETENFSLTLETKILPGEMFYLDGNIIKSSDENINWRMSIWQTTILDMYKSDRIMFGNPINEPIPIMKHPYYRTINYENYNLHNYLIQFLAYFGVIGLGAVSTFYYAIIKMYFNRSKLLDIIVLILPVIVVSSFDPSMESVRFPVILYLTLGLINNEKFSTNSLN